MNPLATVLPPFLLEKKLEAVISSWRGHASHPIAVQLWNGKRHALGESPKLVLHIRSPKTLARLMEPSLASLGAAYVEGEIDFEGHMRDAIDTIAGFIATLAPASRRARPRKARHTRKLDSDSIEHHYDVSNDFYRLWLDEQMVYSCAYFRTPDDGLEQAQIQKIDHILGNGRGRAGSRRHRESAPALRANARTLDRPFRGSWRTAARTGRRHTLPHLARLSGRLRLWFCSRLGGAAPDRCLPPRRTGGSPATADARLYVLANNQFNSLINNGF